MSHIGKLLLLSVALFLAGCQTPPLLPDNYEGPTARLEDTGFQQERFLGVLFVALAVDDRRIHNMLGESRGASAGMGRGIAIRPVVRRVPAQAIKVTLMATQHVGMPIEELFKRGQGTFLSIEGVVSFTPAQGRDYFVTGELSKDQACVWVADYYTRERVTEKVCK